MIDDLYCKYTEVDTKEDIRPCPFCGSEAYLNDYEQPEGHHKKVVMCGNADCPMDMPPNGFYMPTKREALAIWNKRQDMAAWVRSPKPLCSVLVSVITIIPTLLYPTIWLFRIVRR